MQTPLTPRQALFVLEYLKDQNASAAAGRAGYTASNLASQGHELMKIPAIRDRIRQEMQARLAQVRCSALELMKQRMRAAFFSIDHMCGPGWTLRPIEEIDEPTRQVLEVSTTLRKSGPEMRIKQPDRDKALRALERAHERLDKLNEAYYASLEKAGAIPSLAEIEAMDGGTQHQEESPPDQNPQNPQDLSGSASATPSPQPRIAQNHQDLSGSHPPHAKTGQGANAEKHQEMSAQKICVGNRPKRFSEKRQVLSGSHRQDRRELAVA